MSILQKALGLPSIHIDQIVSQVLGKAQDKAGEVAPVIGPALVAALVAEARDWEQQQFRDLANALPQEEFNSLFNAMCVRFQKEQEAKNAGA